MRLPLGRGVHRPLLPAGEKVPEGRMRGGLPRLGERAITPLGSVVFSEDSRFFWEGRPLGLDPGRNEGEELVRRLRCTPDRWASTCHPPTARYRPAVFGAGRGTKLSHPSPTTREMAGPDGDRTPDPGRPSVGPTMPRRPERNDPTPIPRSDADRSPFEPDFRPTGLEPIRGAGPTRPVAMLAVGGVGSGDRTVDAVRRRNDLDCPGCVKV